MSLPYHLINIGYESFRRRWDGKHWVDVKEGFKGEYSTQTNGGLFYVFKKEGLVDIYFGLNEAYKPPTLIYPRPRKDSKTIDGYQSSFITDDEMNRILMNNSPEKILEMIL